MAAERAVETISRTSDRAYLAECQLLLARALLAGQHFDAAHRLASAVAENLRAAGRLPWAALAESVAIEAEVKGQQPGVPPSPVLLDRAQPGAAFSWIVKAGPSKRRTSDSSSARWR